MTTDRIFKAKRGVDLLKDLGYTLEDTQKLLPGIKPNDIGGPQLYDQKRAIEDVGITLDDGWSYQVTPDTSAPLGWRESLIDPDGNEATDFTPDTDNPQLEIPTRFRLDDGTEVSQAELEELAVQAGIAGAGPTELTEADRRTTAQTQAENQQALFDDAWVGVFQPTEQEGTHAKTKPITLEQLALAWETREQSRLGVRGEQAGDVQLDLPDAEKTIDTFLDTMIRAGRTPQTEAIWRAMGVTDAQLDEFYPGQKPKINDVLKWQDKVNPPTSTSAPIFWSSPENQKARTENLLRGLGVTAQPDSPEYKLLTEDKLPRYVETAWEVLMQGVWTGDITGVQSTKDFFLSVLPEFFLQPPKAAEYEKRGKEVPDFSNTIAAQLKQQAEASYERSQAKFEEWTRDNKLALPEPYLQASITEHPELLHDAKWWAYTLGSVVPMALTAVTTTLTVSYLTGNPLIGMTAGAATFFPSQTQDMYEALREAGADERQAASIAMPVGLLMSAVESIGDLPFLKSISPQFMKLFKKEASKELAKATFKQMAKKGLKTFTQVEISETLEEIAQQTLQNIGLKLVNENQDITEGLADTAIQAGVASLLFAVVGGGAQLRASGADIKSRAKEIAVGERGAVTPEGFAPKQGKEPWQMTRAEREADITQQGSKSIEEWNKSGSKGFPPSNPARWDISRLIKAGEQLGYKPRSPEMVNLPSIPQHKVEVMVALSEGKPVPQTVLADYPDLRQQAAVTKQPEAPLTEGSLYQKEVELYKATKPGEQFQGEYITEDDFALARERVAQMADGQIIEEADGLQWKYEKTNDLFVDPTGQSDRMHKGSSNEGLNIAARSKDVAATPAMAPSTSVQPGMEGFGKEAAQVEMFGEVSGKESSKPGLFDVEKLKAQQAQAVPEGQTQFDDIARQLDEAQANLEVAKQALDENPLLQFKFQQGNRKVALDSFISLREGDFPQYLSIKQAEAIWPRGDWASRFPKGHIPKGDVLDQLTKELNMTPDEIAEAANELRKQRRAVDAFARQANALTAELSALPPPPQSVVPPAVAPPAPPLPPRGAVPPTTPPAAGQPVPAVAPLPKGRAEIDRIIAQSTEQIRQRQPGSLKRLALKIPGVKQLLEFERPGLKMTGENEKVLVALVAENAAKADVSVWAMSSRFQLLTDLKKAFGKEAMRGGQAENVTFKGTPDQAANPITGTIKDIADNPELYTLTPEQEGVLVFMEARNDQLLEWVTDNYGAEIGRFTAKTGGAFLPNVDVSEDVVEYLGGEMRAAATGRGKTRIWQTARERMAGRTPFKPELDVVKLIEGLDRFKASAAAGQTYRAAIEGLTRDEAMQKTHPQLYDRMLALKKRLASLKGSAGTLERNLHNAITTFEASPKEDSDLATLRDELEKPLQSGPRAGYDAAAVRAEIDSIRAEIQALRPAWKNANLKPYVFLQEGIYRYFPSDTAKLITESRRDTNNPILNLIEMWRGQAFSGDFSPFAIQGQLGVLADPWGSLKAGVGMVRKSISERDLLRAVKIDALAQDIANNPVEWGEYASLMGRTLSGTPAEYAAGFLSKIPGFDKFTEATYITVTRTSFDLWRRETQHLMASGIPEVEAKVAAAEIASDVFPLVNPALQGQSPARSKFLRAMPTSYSFLRQPVSLIAEAATAYGKLATFQKLTPSEAMAARVVAVGGASTLALAATSAALSAMAAGKDDDEVLEAMWDAINPDPYNGNFASLIIGGKRIPLGGPYRAVFRAIWPQEVEGVPFPVPFAGVPRYLKNRITPAVGTQIDLLVNKDYSGRQIIKGDTFVEKLLRGLAYEFENILPLTLGSGAEALRQGEDYHEDILEQMMAQFMGVNLVTLDNTYLDRMQRQLGTQIGMITKPYTVNRPDIYDARNIWTDVVRVLKARTKVDLTKEDPIVQAIWRGYGIKAVLDQMPSKTLKELADDPFSDTSALSRRDNDLIRQYELAEDKTQFLKDHPEMTESKKEAWLRDNPKENGLLAAFGQAKVYTEAAYKEARRLIKELDLPESAVEGYLPPEDIAKPYFEYQDKLNEFSPNSAEMKLLGANNPKLFEFLGREPVTEPIKSLELKVKYRDQEIPSDDKRRLEAWAEGADDATTAKYVEYGKVIDQFSAGSAEAKLFRVDNPELEQWGLSTGRWQPVDANDVKKWRIDVQYRDKEMPDSVKREREAYEMELSPQNVSKWIEYNELPDYGYWRKRYLRDNPEFATDAKKTPGSDRIPSPQFDLIYEQYKADFEADEAGTLENPSPEFVEAKRAREAYGKFVPEDHIENYIRYYSVLDADKPDDYPKGLPYYEDDFFLIENRDFYREVYLGILGNERRDFRKTPPTRALAAKWIDYNRIENNQSARDQYRIDNRDLDEWGVSVGIWTRTMSKASKKSETGKGKAETSGKRVTSRSQVLEDISELNEAFDKRLEELRRETGVAR